LLELGKELSILGICTGPAALDKRNSQAIELTRNSQFVLQGEGKSFALSAVSEGGVVDGEGGHEGVREGGVRK
jgi:hypothetical protein